MRTSDQHVHAMRTNEAHNHCADQTDIQAGIFERLGHCQNARANVALQQMNHRVQIRSRMLQRPMQRWIVVDQ